MLCTELLAMRDQGWAIWVLAHDGCTDILGLFWCVRFEGVKMKMMCMGCNNMHVSC